MSKNITGDKNVLIPPYCILLAPNKIYSAEENYKYFVGYLYGDYNGKPLHIMLPVRVHM